MTKIKSFEAACKALKIKPALPDVSLIPEDQQAAIIAHYKLVIIAKALNNGWTPNWSDSSEYKYYPWFDMSKPSELVCVDYDVWYARSRVGSRLCFKDRETAKYAGTTFKELYEAYFLIK